MENENESEPEHSLEEVEVGGFLVLALLSHHLHLPRVLHQTRVEVPSLGGRGILRGGGGGAGGEGIVVQDKHRIGELDMGMRHNKRRTSSCKVCLISAVALFNASNWRRKQHA